MDEWMGRGFSDVFFFPCTIFNLRGKTPSCAGKRSALLLYTYVVLAQERTNKLMGFTNKLTTNSRTAKGINDDCTFLDVTSHPWDNFGNLMTTGLPLIPLCLLIAIDNGEGFVERQADPSKVFPFWFRTIGRFLFIL